MEQVYIIVAILTLLVIFALWFVVNKHKKKQKLSRLTILAFFFIIGSFFFEDRTYVYSLLGIGLALAVADIYMKMKK